MSDSRCQALQCWVHLLQSKLLVKISQVGRLVERVGCESPNPTCTRENDRSFIPLCRPAVWRLGWIQGPSARSFDATAHSRAGHIANSLNELLALATAACRRLSFLKRWIQKRWIFSDSPGALGSYGPGQPAGRGIWLRQIFLVLCRTVQSQHPPETVWEPSPSPTTATSPENDAEAVKQSLHAVVSSCVSIHGPWNLANTAPSTVLIASLPAPQVLDSKLACHIIRRGC